VGEQNVRKTCSPVSDVVNKAAKSQGFGHLMVSDQFPPLSFNQLKTKDGQSLNWRGVEELISSQASFSRTGELLNMEVWLISETGMELRSHEVATNERFVLSLPNDLLEELDEDKPWEELFQMVGLKSGPPRELVFPTLMGRKETKVKPFTDSVILTIYQYDFSRYYCNVYHVDSQRLSDLVLTEENISDEALDKLKPYLKLNVDFVFEFLRKYLYLGEKEADGGQEQGQLYLELKYNKDDPFVPGSD